MQKGQDVLSNAIHQAVSESMENMVFMPVEPMTLIWGQVRVLKPYEGGITVAFPERLVEQFTGELHDGESDNGAAREMGLDIVAEMANTIAGRLMNLLVPEDMEYEIGLPKTGSGDIEFPSSGCHIEHFDIGGTMYAVIVEGEDLLAHRLQAIEKQAPTSAPSGW